MSKNSISSDLISQYEGIFRCPICLAKMSLVQAKSLRCTNRHSFDLAKQGYVNLSLRSFKSKYNKRLFEARRAMYRSGFFEPVHDRISEMIIDELENRSEPYQILDAGCGEGFHLSNIQKKIAGNTGNNILGVGVDISKEGIASAAKEYPGAIWCVADLAKCPFATKQFNFILNILSPSNYVEFRRMMADDGIVVKVIPGSNYLKQVREVFFDQPQKQQYANDNRINRFRENFSCVEVERVQYNFHLDHTQVEPLLYMSPLAWGTSEEHLQQVADMKIDEVTIDVTILVGRR